MTHDMNMLKWRLRTLSRLLGVRLTI
jgi:hypothetical protein